MKNIFIHFILSIVLLSCNKKGGKEEVDSNVRYICSMDPQVVENKPGTCPICKMELTKTVVSSDKDDYSLKLSETQIKLANIKIEEVKTGSIGEEIRLRGMVFPDERKAEIISSRVPGRIEKLYFKNEGENIKAGDHVYDIYSEELQEAIQQYLLFEEKAKQIIGGDVNYQQMAKASKDKLIFWGLSENQINNFNSRSVSSLIPFYSKVSGLVNKTLVNEGDYVNEGSPVLNIVNYSSLWVQAEVYPDELTYVYPGLKVKVVIEASPKESIEGRVSFENPELQAQSKITLARVEIENKEGKYKPGMRATVMVTAKEIRGISVPESAILIQPKMNIAWIMNENGTFISKMVEVGTGNNGNVQILSGLREGDKLVVSGVYLLNSEYLLRKGSNSMDNMPGMKENGNVKIHQH